MFVQLNSNDDDNANDNDNNDDDDDLDPSESMSRHGEFNIEATPSAVDPPEAPSSDVTAGGTPAYYQMRLQEAEVFPLPVRAHEHVYLDKIFRDLVSYSGFFYDDERYES